MNLLVLSPDELTSGGTAEVRDRRARHVASVLRSRSGDRLRAGILGGPMGFAEVVRSDPDRLVVRLELHAAPPAPLPITVALALPRPPVFRRLLTHLSALGVKQIHVFHADRVEKSYWQSPTLASEAMHAALVNGLEQAGDTILPEISLHRRFDPFVTEVLAGVREPVLWADPAGEQACPSALDRPTTVLVGPEGGFFPWEIARLQERGFARVSLGPRVLRTETAVVALIGRIAPAPTGSSTLPGAAAGTGGPC